MQQQDTARFHADRIRTAALYLLDAIADATPTPIDDWIIEWLRSRGASEEVIQTMKPERTGEPEDGPAN